MFAGRARRLAEPMRRLAADLSAARAKELQIADFRLQIGKQVL